jgi:hypothetical protein
VPVDRPWSNPQHQNPERYAYDETPLDHYLNSSAYHDPYNTIARIGEGSRATSSDAAVVFPVSNATAGSEKEGPRGHRKQSASAKKR